MLPPTPSYTGARPPQPGHHHLEGHLARACAQALHGQERAAGYIACIVKQHMHFTTVYHQIIKDNMQQAGEALSGLITLNLVHFVGFLDVCIVNRHTCIALNSSGPHCKGSHILQPGCQQVCYWQAIFGLWGHRMRTHLAAFFSSGPELMFPSHHVCRTTDNGFTCMLILLISLLCSGIEIRFGTSCYRDNCRGPASDLCSCPRPWPNAFHTNI